MTNESIFTAERLATLLNTHKGGNLDTQYGPARFLAELVEDTMREQDLSTVQALEFIAAQGPDWTAGTNGRIAVRVREGNGESVTQWDAHDGTWCTLELLVEAISEGNPYPRWYEDEWVEVMDEDGKWVQRDTLAARQARAADGSASVAWDSQ